MSFLFLTLALLTGWFSHYWANRSKPDRSDALTVLKKYKGSALEFREQLKKHIQEHKNLILLEAGHHNFLILQQGGLFNYGHFFHISVAEKESHLEVTVDIQAKLISSDLDKKQLSNSLLSSISLEDVS